MRNSVIVTGISGVERIGAVVQTILIARALGIVEYGIYGLLFTTIGLVASVVGLQMGLTATVLIARYRVTDKSNAGAVIRHVNRFAVLVALAFVLACLPASGWISQALFKSPDYAAAVLLGVAFIGVTLISGVQDGIVQGFEDFTAMARARLIAAFVTLVLIYPGAIVFGLTGVVAVILGGVGIKMAMLSFVVQSHRRREAIPSSGGTIRFWSMVVDFSLPSMLVSLLMGGITWYGSYLLSRQSAGFSSVALVNTGLQWRGPVLLVAASIGTVAVPVFSRFAAVEDRAGGDSFQRRLVGLNALGALAVSIVLVLLSRPLLALYGPEFQAGTLTFALLVLSTVPTVVANVYMQKLVGSGRMWLQLIVQLPVYASLLLGFAWLVPHQQAEGYAISMMAASLVFGACAYAAHLFVSGRRTPLVG